MKDKITALPKKAKNHIVRHRAVYGFIAGATTATVVCNKLDRVDRFNIFLEEKGLTDEFYKHEL